MIDDATVDLAPERTSTRTTQPSRTVTLAIQGGLGNQLFQWAFATALRERGHRVVLDTTRCRGDRPLAIEPLISGWPRVGRPRGLALVAAHRYRPGLVPGLVEERGNGHDPTLLSRVEEADSYVVGYFQSPRYFDHLGDAVRRDVLSFLESQLTEEGLAQYEENRASDDSVAVHVRRGDYVQVAKFAEHHGSLDEPYYGAVKQLLRERGLGSVTWFSDDLPWVRANLAADGDRYCTPTSTRSAAGEIALMASCRTRVVANSTFSWWAGWLGRPPAEDRPVIAPAVWFKARPDDPTDLVPSTWVRL